MLHEIAHLFDMIQPDANNPQMVAHNNDQILAELRHSNPRPLEQRTLSDEEHPFLMICGAAAALRFVWGQAAGQSPPSGLACVAEMTVPVYSGLPWLARVTGEARVSITVGRNGIP